MRRVVVRHQRDVGEKDRLEIERDPHLVESRHPPVLLQWAGICLRVQPGARPRQHAGEPGNRLAP